MAGGYGNHIENTVAVHTQTVALAAACHARFGALDAGLSSPLPAAAA